MLRDSVISGSKQIEELNDTVAAENQQIEELKKTIASNNEQVEELNKTIGTKNSKISSQQSEIKEMQDKVDFLDKYVVVVSDDFGECELASWKKLVAIAAGYKNTLGRVADGKVVNIGYRKFLRLKNEVLKSFFKYWGGSKNVL